MKFLDETLIADKIARKLGYKDYPDDSVEQGDTWHTEPSKAPFDKTIRKEDFKKLLFKGHYTLKLIEQFKVNIKHTKHWVELSNNDNTLLSLISVKPLHLAVIEFLSCEDLILCNS